MFCFWMGTSQYITPRFKRYGIVFGSALVLVILIFATSKRHEKPDYKAPEKEPKAVDFTGVPPKELTLNRISADLERMHQQQQALHAQHQKEMDSLKERVQQEIQQLSQSEPVQHPGPAAESHEPSAMPDVLQWNQYSPPPPNGYKRTGQRSNRPHSLPDRFECWEPQDQQHPSRISNQETSQDYSG